MSELWVVVVAVAIYVAYLIFRDIYLKRKVTTHKWPPFQSQRTIGAMWLDGTTLHYIDAQGAERHIVGKMADGSWEVEK